MTFPFCDGTGHMTGMGYGLGPWFQLLIVFLFFLVVFWMIKGGTQSQYKVSQKDTAQEILQKRYVSGEITKKQYEDMKKEISE
ncbi:SHOCT domain-containing protein [archaeon]|nr:SHOCT domain-containing protein [archaeon]